MAEFGSLGFVELKLTLGEIGNLLLTGGAAYYVGWIIQRRHTNDRVLRDALCGLCTNGIAALDAVSLGWTPLAPFPAASCLPRNGKE